MGKGVPTKRHGRLFKKLSLLSADAAPVLTGVTAGDAITLVANGPSQSGPPRLKRFVVYTGGIMTPELNLPNKYRGSVVVDLDGLILPEQTTPLHRDHDTAKPVGHAARVSTDGRALYAEDALLSITSDDQAEIYSGLKNGFPWKPSVGLKLYDYEIIPAGRTIKCNGQTFEGPILYVSLAELKEIGIVSVPGDDAVDALTLAAMARLQGSHNMKFNAWLKAQGIEQKTLKPLAKKVLKVHYDSLQAADGDDPKDDTAEGEDDDKEGLDAQDDDEVDPESDDEPTDEADGDESDDEEEDLEGEDDEEPKATAKAKASGKRTVDLRANMRKTAAAEERRIAKIQSVCRKFDNPMYVSGRTKTQLSAHAISMGWTPEKTELMARRAKDVEAKRGRRPQAPAIHTRNRTRMGTLAAMQAGLMLRAGVQLDSPAFEKPDIKRKLTASWLQQDVDDPQRDKVMNEGEEWRYSSMMDICQAACDAHGVHYRRGDKIGILNAAMSTGSVSSLFGATIGARLLESYAEIKDFTEGWCQTAENPDLEKHVRVRLEGAQDLEHNPTGQPAAHAQISAKNEYAGVDRFAKQINIDEADVLGDNFGKLKDTPRDFGLAAGRVVPNLVAAVLLSNPNLNQTGRALFNSTDGSSATGVALANGTLSAAIAALAKRKDGDTSIELAPTHLLVAPDQVDAANQIVNSAVISNDSGKGSTNVLNAYGIEVRGVARLANGLVHPLTKASLAGSTTKWYLVSAEGHTIEITFLEGAGRVPMVRVTELVNGMFGLNVDVRHYAGATPLDFRPFYRGDN